MKKTLTMFLLVFVLIGLGQAEEPKYVPGGAARQLALGGSPTNASVMDYTDIYTNPAWAIKYTDFIYSELGYNFAGYSAMGQSAGFTYSVFKGLSVGLSVGKQEGQIFAINSYGAQITDNITGVNGAPTTVNVTNSDNFLGGMNTYITGAGFPGISSANWRPLQVYSAFKIAGLTVGAALYRVGYSVKQDFTDVGDVQNTTNEASIGQTGLKVGTLIDLNLFLIDASALLRFNSATAKMSPPAPATSSEVSATGTEIAINARLFMKLGDKLTLVPMARFMTFGYEPEIKQTVAAPLVLNSKPNDYRRTDIEFGIGANITIPGGKVFAGLSLESISLKNDVTYWKNNPGSSAAANDTLATTKHSGSIFSLPKVSLGAEFDIASWLTGRLGYFKAFAGRTLSIEAPAPVKKQEESETFNDYVFCPQFNLATSAQQLLSVGLSVHFDRLSFDGYLCETWLSNGPWIISGAGTAMFGVLSMSYSFN